MLHKALGDRLILIVARDVLGLAGELAQQRQALPDSRWLDPAPGLGGAFDFIGHAPIAPRPGMGLQAATP
jgi:hypothetical protein